MVLKQQTLIMWEGIDANPDDHYGFVYRITDTETGKDYIGRKYYWRTVKLPPLKGKMRRRKRVRESDWATYYGSSDALSKDIETFGKERFKREILFQGARGEVNYIEAKYQFDEDVLLRDDSYNGQIHIRIGGMAINSLRTINKKG